jgi:hypothetical protein
MSETIHLIDSGRTVVATAQVTDENGLFSGSVALEPMPAAMRAKFEEYETIIQGQMFGLLDRVEDEIEQLNLKAVFPQGREEALTDLQLYPRTKRVSFRLQSVPIATRPASNGAAVSR